jgi:hypothetical protein
MVVTAIASSANTNAAFCSQTSTLGILSSNTALVRLPMLANCKLRLNVFSTIGA